MDTEELRAELVRRERELAALSAEVARLRREIAARERGRVASESASSVPAPTVSAVPAPPLSPAEKSRFSENAFPGAKMFSPFVGKI